LKATEAVKSGRIPKKDKKKCKGSSLADEGSNQQKGRKKSKSGFYCMLCAAKDTEEKFIYSHNNHAEDCSFKEEYAEALTSSQKATLERS